MTQGKPPVRLVFDTAVAPVACVDLSPVPSRFVG